MKKLKIITITLAIILVTMVAFLGVYNKVQNRMENKVKDYSLAMDLKGARNLILVVDKHNKTVIKDSEGKEVEDSENLTDEEITQKGYVKEEVPANSDDVLNAANYKKTKKVIEKRLKELKVSDYEVRLNEETGDIIISLAENDNTDAVVSSLTTTGKFEILDTETGETLLNNNDIKSAKVMYANEGQTATSKGTSVYLEIEFTKSGSKVLEDISNKYVKVESTEENKEASEKTITMKIDDAKIMSTSFDEPINTGKIQLTVGSASQEQETIRENFTRASNMATILDSGNIPVEYDIENNEYVLSQITDNELAIAIYVILAVIVIGLIVLVVKYKKMGLLGVISFIGLISLFTLVIRYTNVVISIGGIIGFVLTLCLNYFLINKILTKIKKTDNINGEKANKIFKDSYVEFFVRIIPVCIATIVFCFAQLISISSFGMVMFWGIVLIAIYNLLITNNLIKIEIKK